MKNSILAFLILSGFVGFIVLCALLGKVGTCIFIGTVLLFVFGAVWWVIKSILDDNEPTPPDCVLME